MTEREVEPVDILVVDDRPEDLLALGETLNVPHYRLALVDSPREALKHLLERDFAVILLDVRMPEIDGFELARLIRERDRTSVTPIIFLTGADANPGQIYKGYAAGAVDYLQKPVDRDVLRAKVGIFAELYRKDLRIAQQARALLEAGRRERELKLAELRVLAERRYANLAEAIPELVVTLDAAGSLEYCNRRWQEYTGLSADESRGEGWVVAIHPDDKKRAIRAWEQSLASGEVLEVECRLKRGFDGAMRWHTCRALPERDEDGSVTGWLGTYSDSEDLKQAIRARDEFLSIASHELRTPVAGIKGYAQLLLRAEARGRLDPDRLRRSLQAIDDVTDRLTTLTQDLLDVSRIRLGQLPLRIQQIDLRELVQRVTQRFSEHIPLTHTILVEAEAEPCPIPADADRLEQVLTNLLENAVKYSPDGGTVRVTLSRAADEMLLSVQDHGIGLPDDAAESIFRPFGRAPNAARHNLPGMGLGLYICQNIVERHGGRIVAHSDGEGHGTTLEIALPCGAGTPPPPEAPPPEALPPEAITA